METRLENVRLLAKVYGWKEVSFDPVYKLLTYRRKGVRLNLWYGKMTVATALSHPKLGTTQLIRKKVSHELLEEILNNPRVHTDRGFLVRKGRNVLKPKNETPRRKTKNKVGSDMEKERHRTGGYDNW